MKHFPKLSVIVLFLSLLSLTSVPTPAVAENSYSIEGTVTFYKLADVTLLLLTKDELKNMNENSYKLILKPDSATETSGELPFSMTDVPEGSYVLLAYQDLNNSNKLDSNLLTFSEPWGTFRPQRPGMFFTLNFEDLDFNLDQDLKNIRIRLTK